LRSTFSETFIFRQSKKALRDITGGFWQTMAGCTSSTKPLQRVASKSNHASMENCLPYAIIASLNNILQSESRMTYKVFVDGQEGTTGLQINELLATREDVEVLKIDAEKGKDIAEPALVEQSVRPLTKLAAQAAVGQSPTLTLGNDPTT